MTPITDRLRQMADKLETTNPKRIYGEITISGMDRMNLMGLLREAVAALTPTPAPQEETKNDLTRRDKHADLERQPAASTDAKGSELGPDVVCKHGTALDVHCCECYLGFPTPPNVPLNMPVWKCKTCGCLWRDNLDGAVSLLDAEQKSCAKCEHSPTGMACAIHWLSVEVAQSSDARPTRPEGSQASGSAKSLSSLAVPDARVEGPTTCTCRPTDYGGMVIFGCPVHDPEPVAAPGVEDATPHLPAYRCRPIKQLRDTVSMLAEIVWDGKPKRGQHVWSIPANIDRDWDFILTDAIDELERLRSGASAPAAGSAPHGTASHRWNIEPQPDGSLRVCRGEHDKVLGCEWETYVPAPEPT